jgi:hypothetical protein
MATANVLANDLAPGDRILETGIAGISGLVTAIRVVPERVGLGCFHVATVDVTLANGKRHALGRFEACTVERASASEAA